MSQPSPHHHAISPHLAGNAAPHSAQVGLGGSAVSSVSSLSPTSLNVGSPPRSASGEAPFHPGHRIGGGSSSDQNGMLVALIRNGEVLHRSGQRAVVAAGERLRKLERASSKLIVAQRELSTQAEACAAMVNEMADGCQKLDRSADELAVEYARRQNELQATLDALANRTVATALAGAPASPAPLSRSGVLEPPAPQTLFDYVDGESVHVLQGAYLHGVSQLSLLSEQARNALLQRSLLQMDEVRKMEAELREKMGVDGADGENQNTAASSSAPMSPSAVASPSSSSAVGLPFGSSVLSQANTAFLALEGDVGELQRLFSELCSSYDRVRNINLAALEAAQHAGASEADLTQSTIAATNEVARELEQMQAMERTMHATAQHMNAHAQQVEAASGAHAALYSQTLQLFNTLSAFGPSLKTALASFHSIQLEHGNIAAAIHQTLTELRNLQLWYVQFERSYAALLEEIQRRHRQMHHMQAFMSSVAQQLGELHLEEQATRESFYHSYGRYLPPTLCPAVQEEPTMVQLVPDTLRTDLPVYLPTLEDQEAARKLMAQASLSNSNQSMSTTAHTSAEQSHHTSPTPAQQQQHQQHLSGHMPMQGHPGDYSDQQGHAQYHTLASNELATLQSIIHPHPHAQAAYPHTLSPPPLVQLQQLEQRLQQQQQGQQQGQYIHPSTSPNHAQAGTILAPTPVQPHSTTHYSTSPIQDQHGLPPHHQQHLSQQQAHGHSASFSSPSGGSGGLPLSTSQHSLHLHALPPFDVGSASANANLPIRPRAGSYSVKPVAPRGFSDDD